MWTGRSCFGLLVPGFEFIFTSVIKYNLMRYTKNQVKVTKQSHKLISSSPAHYTLASISVMLYVARAEFSIIFNLSTSPKSLTLDLTHIPESRSSDEIPNYIGKVLTFLTTYLISHWNPCRCASWKKSNQKNKVKYSQFFRRRE